ncbi:hypothetical protein R6242_09570 [Iodobacter sp. CM08]|uniref:hypothetical protein n=1 Tax=Iodobacter sp. CM08 TaxID=3085902 RepID=UPI0029810460|nr:hypothetical protein [Iodobacter sp. CM08]MDW5416812.1 hypothetical protein [Iodobacter sp. CM08]
MKDQFFSDDVAIVSSKRIQINHAHFHRSASPRLLLAACILLSFALGVVTGRDYLPVRYSVEDKPAMTEQKVDSLVLTINASAAV